MRSIYFALLSLLSLPVLGQNIEADKAAIKSMCGCFQIDFDYVETFPTDTSYELHEPYSTSAAAEWAFVVEESDDNIVIQHLLVVNDTMIVKHWRQDWTYENTDFYQFQGNERWAFEQKSPEEVEGQWTQSVYQVDDSPRYTGSATWVHVDGRHYWENTTDAPLPRREYTHRADYNVLERGNRHEILENDWLHIQNNKKIVRDEFGDKVLVEERGRNVYNRIDDSECQAAIDWWEQHNSYWNLVRAEWNKLFALGEDLLVKKRADNTFLFMALSEHGMKNAEKAAKQPKQVSKEIAEILVKYTTETEAEIEF